MGEPPKPSQPQADKFRDLARQLGCDEDERAFEEQVKKVAGKPPEPEREKPKGA